MRWRAVLFKSSTDGVDDDAAAEESGVEGNAEVLADALAALGRAAGLLFAALDVVAIHPLSFIAAMRKPSTVFAVLGWYCRPLYGVPT